MYCNTWTLLSNFFRSHPAVTNLRPTCYAIYNNTLIFPVDCSSFVRFVFVLFMYLLYHVYLFCQHNFAKLIIFFIYLKLCNLAFAYFIAFSDLFQTIRKLKKQSMQCMLRSIMQVLQLQIYRR